MNPLVIINPNASQSVTDGIDVAVDPFRKWGWPIRCLTSTDGPRAIENQLQADMSIAPMLSLAKTQTVASGFVIACFGDPGVHALRDQTSVPVVGIQEASVATALALGQSFGVISILLESVPRHLRSFGAMGVLDRLAGDRALGLGVADLADHQKSFDAMVRVGMTLKDDDGANVLIMGCAGMARYREDLEEATGLPVVEPCQAAVAMVLGRITAQSPVAQ